MPSLIDFLIAYVIYFLPSLILALFTVVIGLGVYYFGKKINLTLMDNAFDIISREKGELVVDYNLAERSTIGRTYLVELKPGLSLENLRIHFTMVPRHLIVSRIATFIRKRKDYILIEADPSDKIVHRYQIEILRMHDEKSIKALVDMLGLLEKINIGGPNFDRIFGIWVNNPEFFEAAFNKEQKIIKNIYGQRHHITRVSFYPLESPSIRLVAELSAGVHPTRLMDILSDLTTVVTSLAKKGYYAKQKQFSPVVKDRKLEEEKQKKLDKRYKV
ncbi:MAG: hypothetical protein ACXADY_17385 [Candidatus Hodarchaeales archaeon]|jgi:hypothetical protein